MRAAAVRSVTPPWGSAAGSPGRGLLLIKPSAPGIEAETLGSGPAFKPGSDAALVPGCPAPQPPNRAILGGNARAGLTCLLGGRSQQLFPGFPVACGVVTGVDPALFSFCCLAANLEGVSRTFFYLMAGLKWCDGGQALACSMSRTVECY